MSERPPSNRFDLLSRSESGLSYVRERRGGVTRVLTESELEDFNDPPPCPECAEQFGCEHLNCAGEALLPENEIEGAVPTQWVGFAKENGVSAKDVERLATIHFVDGEYRLAAGATTDMRALELLLLLNEEK